MTLSPGAVSAASESAALAISHIILVGIGLRPGLVTVGVILPLIIGGFRLSHAAAPSFFPDVLTRISLSRRPGLHVVRAQSRPAPGGAAWQLAGSRERTCAHWGMWL